MSADLDRMFSVLRTDIDNTVLPAPTALRRTGDRRRRRRAVVGLVAVAVAVAGVSAGAHRILADPAQPAAPPATSVPSADASPTTPEPTGSPVARPGCDEVWVYPYDGPRPAGPALPAGLMLRAADFGRCFTQIADVPGYPAPDRSRGETAPLDLCLATDYPADGKRAAGRLRTFAGGPEVSGYQSVARYRDGGAAELMKQVRARVAGCGHYTLPGTPGDWRASIVASGFAGDESMIVYVGAGPPGTYPGWYYGVARRGDLVTVVAASSDLSGNQARNRELTRQAVRMPGFG